MGNAVTICTFSEEMSDRLPWILDPFRIIQRIPTRTISQPVRYKKQKDEEESSEKESEKEKNSDEEKEKDKKQTERQSSWLWGLLGRQDDDSKDSNKKKQNSTSKSGYQEFVDEDDNGLDDP